MTTFFYLGYIWPTLFSYYIIESFTIKNCVRYEKSSNHTKSFNGILNNTCSNRAEIKVVVFVFNPFENK